METNYQRTTAASRKAALRVHYIHYSAGGRTYVTGATKRKALRWHDKQWAKQARRLAKAAA